MDSIIGKGSTALITGASSGIGREFALQLAQRGCDLVIVARNIEALRALATHLQERYQVLVMAVQADLADQQSPETLYRRVAAAGVSVDILINNAGFNVYGSFLQTDLLEETRMIAVNFTSLVALSKLFGRDMAQRRRGAILSIGSTASFAPAPFASVYAATKAAVLSVSEALSEEFRGTGVTVTVLCPGPIDTEFARRAKMTNTKIFSGKLESAEAVARLGLAALQLGKGLAFTSLADRLQIFSMRFSPRQLIVKVGKSLLSPSS